MTLWTKISPNSVSRKKRALRDFARSTRGGSFVQRLVSKLLILTILPCSLIVSAQGVHAGDIRRFGAQFLNFDGTQQSTKSAPSSASGVPTGGTAIYDVNVIVPADVNTLQVTIAATGDLDQAANSMWLACLVDGAPCNSGTNSASNSPAGWVKVQELAASAQPETAADNNIHYSWCMPIHSKGGKDSLQHAVQLRMASGDGTNTVDIEQIHVFVDGAQVGGLNKANACTVGTP
jgi:hypothetical protein